MKKFIKDHKIDIIINIIFIVSFIFFYIWIIKCGKFVYGSEKDFEYQHFLIPDYLRKLFYDTHNLFPSFAPHLGGGQNIYYISYYGLFSPIIVLSYLFPHIKMLDFIIVSTCLGVIVSTSLFYFYLRKNKYSYITSFLCAFLLMFATPISFHSHRHIMFINYMPFLIMSFYGMDRFIEKKKSVLLMVSIILMIFTSYYYSVSGLLVLFILGIYKSLIKNKKFRFKDLVLYTISYSRVVLLSVLTSMIIILPTFYTLIVGRDGSSKHSILMDFIPKINVLYSHYSMGLTLVSLIGIIYCIFFSKKIYNKFLGITIIIISSFPIFFYILNGFLYSSSKVLIPFIPLTLLLVAEFLMYWFDKTKYKKLTIGYIVLSVIVVNIIVNNFDTFMLRDNVKNNFYSNYDSNVKTINNSNNVYRINSSYVDMDYINRVGNINDYKTTIYSSTSNKNYKYVYKNIFDNPLGARNKLMLYSSSNLLFEMYMGEKYIYSNEEINNIFYNKIKNIDSVYLYENNYVLPIGYATDKVIKESEYNKLNGVEKQINLLGNVITNKDTNTDIKYVDEEEINVNVNNYDNLEYEKDDDKYIINSLDEGRMSISLDKDLTDKILFVSFDVVPAKNDDLSITINGICNKLTAKSWKYYNDNTKFSYVLLNSNGNLNVMFSKGKYIVSNFKFYTLDEKVLKDIKNNINTFNINRDKTKGDYIVGDINVDKDGYFVISVPYDEGFNIKVDNKVIKYNKVNKGFIGFNISSGKHDIEIKYTSPLRNISLIISIIGFISIVGVYIVEKKKIGGIL